jgi:putative sugar O-methyltransferase
MHVSIQDLRSTYEQLAGDERVQSFYSKYPRNLFWDRENQQCSTGIIRDAASVEDMIHRMQRTDLFSVNTDSHLKNLAVDWLVSHYQSHGIDVDTMPSEVEESPHSNPAISLTRGTRRLSIDFLRTVSVAYDIRRYIQRDGPALRSVELGAGLGHLARTLRLTGVSRSHLILDLPESLMFSFAFLTINFPGASTVFVANREQAAKTRPADYDFVFVPSCFAEALDLNGMDLFVNTASLGEMRNETIRYWMDFVQSKTSVKHIFTQNRFLNTIDPAVHAWRWSENECSVHYDRSWRMLKWELEPVWFRCPYIVPIAARHLEIAATREHPQDAAEAQSQSRHLLEEVKQQDWWRRPDEPTYMTMRQNPFVTDVTMTGTLFKLWESIRLNPTSEAVLVLLRYLLTLVSREDLAFEETRYYEQLFLKLARTEGRQDVGGDALDLRQGHASHPVAQVELVAETQDYNIVSAQLILNGPSRDTASTRFYALAKAMGPTNLFLERLGERELAPYILVSDTLEGALASAKQQERR